MIRTVTVGLGFLAGAALIEAALVPGVLIGGAAVLAPRLVPLARRGARVLFDAPGGRPQVAAAGSQRSRNGGKGRGQRGQPAAQHVAALGIKRAIAKTVTFRVIVTSLDFSSNYIVIGEFATAAGLSAFALVAGPVFYFVHETAWNYFGPHGDDAAVDVRPPRRAADKSGRSFAISRPLAKTITFRTVATVMDFTTNYVVVGDLAIAVGLSAFGFVVGPFVYIGHEKLWDYLAPTHQPGLLALPPPARRPASA